MKDELSRFDNDTHYHEDPNHYQEMATIGPRFANQMNIRVYSDERAPIEPHFHVTKGSGRGGSFPFETCVCIRGPHYFVHTFKGQIIKNKSMSLTKDEMFAIDRFLRKENEFGITNWQDLLNRWNSDNPTSHFRFPPNYQQHDYSKISGGVKEVEE
jgi:hypothetical protein